MKTIEDNMNPAYHPANLALQPYPHEAVIELALLARKLGVQFKINGFPYGADFDRGLWNEFLGLRYGEVRAQASDGAVGDGS